MNNEWLAKSIHRRFLRLMGGRKAIPRGSDMDDRIRAAAVLAVEWCTVVGFGRMRRLTLAMIREGQRRLQLHGQPVDTMGVLGDLAAEIQKIDFGRE